MKYMLLTMIGCFALCLIAPAGAEAQPRDCMEPPMIMAQTDLPGDSGRPFWRRHMPPDHMWNKEEGPKHLERLRLIKLLELLELDTDTEAKFIAEYRSFRNDLMDLKRSERMTVDSLAEGIKDEALKEADVLTLIENIRKIETIQRNRMEQFNKTMKGLLDAEQLGKLTVFEARFELEMLGRLSEFRRHPQGMGRMKPWQDSIDSPNDNNNDE